MTKISPRNKLVTFNLSTTNLNEPTPHAIEFGGRAPSKSSLIPHTNSMENLAEKDREKRNMVPQFGPNGNASMGTDSINNDTNEYIPRSNFTSYDNSSMNNNKGGVIYAAMDRDRDERDMNMDTTRTRPTSATNSSSTDDYSRSSNDDMNDKMGDSMNHPPHTPHNNHNFSRSDREKWGNTLTANMSSIDNIDTDLERDIDRDKMGKLNNMITPPPQHLLPDGMNSGTDILTQKARGSHRRNQSEDYDPLRNQRQRSGKYGLHRHHPSGTFQEENPVLNMSNLAELTQNESEMTKNTMDRPEITPAPHDDELMITMEYDEEKEDDIDTQTQITNRSMGIMKQKSEESGLEIDSGMEHEPFSQNLTSLKEFYGSNGNNNNNVVPGEDGVFVMDSNDDESRLSQNNEDSVQFIKDQVDVKQKRKDIKQGGTTQTVGKIQLKQVAIDRQKSMDKMKVNKVVSSKKDKFERMIRENESNNSTTNINQRRKIQISPIDDRNSNESDGEDESEKQENNNNDIGNYDDRTVIVHPDQLAQLQQQNKEQSV